MSKEINEIIKKKKVDYQKYFNQFPNKNFGIFDTETKGKRVVSWFILLSDGRRAYGEKGAGELLAWIKKNLIEVPKSQKKSWFLYSHYGLKYDIAFLLKGLVKVSKIKHNQQRMIQLRYENIYFNDTYLIFPKKLAELPLTKQEKEIKNRGTLLLKSKGGVDNFSRKELVEYCANDCFILLRLLGEFFASQGKLGEKTIGKISTGSISMYLFSKKYPEQKAKFPNLAKPWHEKIYNFIQPSLEGGFVGMANEAIYKKSSYKYDMNSIYPFMMKEEKMPIGLPTVHYTKEEIGISKCNCGVKKHRTPDPIHCLKKKIVYCSKCGAKEHQKLNFDINSLPFGFIKIRFWELEAKENSQIIPFLTMKRENGTTYCPIKINYLERVFFSEYLKFILQHYNYSKVEIEEAYSFNHEQGIFANWVDEHQEKKVEAKEKLSVGKLTRNERDYYNLQYLQNKLLQNSLYGKFGQKKKVREFIWKKKEEKDLVPHWNPIYKKDGENYCLEEGEEKDGFGFNFCPIACATTAYAKICLIKKMHEIGVKNILYWDTDCIFSKIPFHDSCINQTLIGYWKEEAKLSEFICLAAKTYWVKLKDTGKIDWKFKGIGYEPLTKQKVDPREIFFEGKEIWSKSSIKYNWGVKIEETLNNILPARFNPKAELKQVKKDWIWQPFAQDGMEPPKRESLNTLYGIEIVRREPDPNRKSGYIYTKLP